MADAVRGDFAIEYGETSRTTPPASTGLRAPSDKLGRTDQRDRQEHPAQRGRMSDERADQLVDLTMRMLGKLTPKEIAIEAGVGADATAVKSIVKAARKTLAERAEFYVEAHGIATVQAALQGDAKPAQWALERNTESGERIVDAPEAEKPLAPPTFNLGFMLGGVPVQATALPAAVDGDVVK